MNDRNATATLTEQRAPVSAIAHGAKERLSLLWIFYMFNAAYIDITTLYYSVFINHKPAVHYTQAFLLGAGVLIEISIAMILLSRVLNYRANRWTNIIAAIFLTIVQLVTLFVKTPTLAYIFFSVIMIATTAFIAWYAWKWPNTEVPA
jgi:Na+/melibiose symporter-like transporter